jgi:hypothetical protein
MSNAEPPYTPGFGRRPRVVAGRDELVHSCFAPLRTGPRHPYFCSALIGHRGVGKTVVASILADRARNELHWPVLAVQALNTDSLLLSVARKLPTALEAWNTKLSREYKRFISEVTVGVNLGILSASATVRSAAPVAPPGAADELETLLATIGRFAAKHGRGVLITIDEAQYASKDDLAGIARALQTVISIQQLPVAVIFSGLPAFQHRLAAAGTFASRLPTRAVEDLDPWVSRSALELPSRLDGIEWQGPALDLVVDRSGGHPYYLQLFGFHTWEAAQKQEATTITTAHATAGLRSGRAQLDGEFATTWAKLRPGERRYLWATAHLGGRGRAAVGEIADRLGKTPKALSVARSRLINDLGLLDAPAHGSVRFVSGEMADWVSSQPSDADAPSR